MNLKELQNELRKFASEEKAAFYPRYFKTGIGEYAEGDKFLGVTIPSQRKIVSKYKNLSLKDIDMLLNSEFHEERSVALAILVNRFKSGGNKMRGEIFKFYLKNSKQINNWDLVDISADKIVGEYLYQNPNHNTKFKGEELKGIKLLKNLAESENIWERRIAMIATFAFIKHEEIDLTFKISKMLLDDKHDLIHKAVGWMLREAGKRDQKKLEEFLKENYMHIPRTALRYAIEKFPPEKRSAYLTGDFSN